MGPMSDTFKNWFHSRANWIAHFIYFISSYYSCITYGSFFQILTLNVNLKWFHRFLYARTITTKVTGFFYEFVFPLSLFRKLFLEFKQCNEETNFKICSTLHRQQYFFNILRVSNVESMPLVWKVHYTWMHMISIWIFPFFFSRWSNLHDYLSNRRHMTMIGMPKLDFALHEKKKNVKYYWQ